MNYNYIADTIKNLRKQYKFSQKQLAEKSGVSQTTISRLENVGKGGKLDLQFDTLEKICSVFNLSFDDLISASLEYSGPAVNNVLFSTNRLDMRLQNDILFPGSYYPYTITTLMELLVCLPIVGEERILDLYVKYDFDFVNHSKDIVNDLSKLVDGLNADDPVVKHAKYLLDCIGAVRYNKPVKQQFDHQDCIDYAVCVTDKISAIKAIKNIANDINIINKNYGGTNG